MRILIVDDDELSASILENVLTKAGHQVRTASDGLEALTILKEEQYRMVITDWEMPVMDGIELCKAIRAENLAGYVYIILLTSRDSSQETIEGLSAGADDFIVKPFDPGEMIARVRSGERVLSLETREVAIFALAKLAESRDPETGAHLERVQCYSRILAQQLCTHPKFSTELDAEYIRLIYLTSPLHDIGKVGIPDSVLLKPGRLSDEEFDIMKTHTVIGATTLEAALAKFPEAKFLRMARDIAATHHERFNGSGYPKGLIGEEIPLCGRIVALADVYDALTSKRVYKEAFLHGLARNIILEESGRHFDPLVVDAFMQCEHQFIAVRERFSESPAESTQAVLVTS
jgi:putative two-component system response regulator